MNSIGLGILALLGLASWWTPYLMRRDLLFGVTVPPAFRDTSAARAIIRRYQMLVVIWAAASIGIQDFLWRRSQHMGVLWAVAPLWIALGSAIAFAKAHKATVAHAVRSSGVREVELLPPSPRSAEYPWMLLVGPAVLAVGFAVGFLMPDSAGRIPLFAGWQAVVAHWNAIESLVDKPLSFALGACLGSFAALVAFRFGTRRSPAGLTNYRRVMLRNIILFNAAFAAFSAWVFDMGAFGRVVDKIELREAGALIFAGLAAHVAYVLMLRRKENMALASAGQQPLGDRTPDDRWLWGKFYHNPDDPALFVEARCGPGYTMNFGQVRAWLIIGGFLIVMVAPLVM